MDLINDAWNLTKIQHTVETPCVLIKALHVITNVLLRNSQAAESYGKWIKLDTEMGREKTTDMQRMKDKDRKRNDNNDIVNETRTREKWQNSENPLS